MLAAYILQQTSGFLPDGFHSPSPAETVIVDVFGNEEQAYGEAIHNLVGWVRHSDTRLQEDIRKVLKEKGPSLKWRFNKIAKFIDESDTFVDSEVIKYKVVEKLLMKSKKVNEQQVLQEALIDIGQKAAITGIWPERKRTEEGEEAESDSDFDAGRKKGEKGNKNKKRQKTDVGFQFDYCF